MHHIIYSSRIAGGMSPTELITLLMGACQANEAVGITGALVYSHERFMQLLEGERQVIQRLYGRIERDERHYEVNKLVDKETRERTFPGWPMAFRRVSLTQFEDLATFLTPMQHELQVVTANPVESRMLAHLRQVVLEW